MTLNARINLNLVTLTHYSPLQLVLGIDVIQKKARKSFGSEAFFCRFLDYCMFQILVLVTFEKI